MAAAELELVRRCRTCDPRAWEALVRCSAPMVYRVAYRVLGDRAQAEDATQEAFLRMYRSFATYDPTRAFEPWACRITVNVCLRRLDKGAKRELVTRELRDLPTGNGDTAATTPEALAARREALAVLEQGFAELTPRDRAFLTLRYREGFSDAEVAQACDESVNTVKSRILRARTRLAHYLKRSLGGDES